MSALPGRQEVDISFSQSIPNSQRQLHLRDAGFRTMRTGQTVCRILGKTNRPFIKI